MDIKTQKRDHWSRPGGAAAYEEAVSSTSPINQIQNRVEIEMVLAHAKGNILDAGTGTGRFAIPLAHASNSVVALDYAVEMLTLNRTLASRQGITSTRYVRGDVEALPFPDGHFDAVVSMTVVRHFPTWQTVLSEFLRVLRPGGILIFEMCSGDHVNAANRISPRFGVKYAVDGFWSYEAEVPFAELRAWLDVHDVDVVERRTYGFLNDNALLQLAMVNRAGYTRAVSVIEWCLKLNVLRELAIQAELRLLHRLSPAWSTNYFVVGRKR